MSRRRRLATIAAGTAGLLLLAHPVADAVDVWGNIGPASQLPAGALMDAYPLGNYALDHHFSAVEAGVFSGVDVSGIAPTVAWLLASVLWQLTAFLASAVITLFTFAFSLDLVNGSDATGGAGALQPVSEAVRSIYRDVFGGPWLTLAVLLAGVWSMWQALVRRRYTETASALGLSLLYIVIALAFVTQPERTIGTASHWTNEVSVAFLSLSSNGSVSDEQQAKEDSSDHLFELLVYQPWVVLQFGGLEHCVRDDADAAVRPLSPDPGRDAQLARRLATSPEIQADAGKTCVNHRLKYAPHFLRFSPESDQRDAEYDALKDGDSSKLPDEDPGKDDGTYRLSDLDKPAAEAMGKSGQYQRLGLAVVIFAGELGAFLLLGSLAVAVILAQVLVLLLLAFAPVALVIGTFPGRGHQFFLDWLTRLATFLIKKAFYALILAVLLAVSAALQDATANLGWLMAWGLQAVFYWAVFLNRKQLVGQLGTAVTGTTGQRDEARLLAGVGVGYAMARLARRTIGAAARATRRRPGTGGHDGAPRRPRPVPELPPPSPHTRPLPEPDEEASSSAGRPTRPARDTDGADSTATGRAAPVGEADPASVAPDRARPRPPPTGGAGDETARPIESTERPAAERRPGGKGPATADRREAPRPQPAEQPEATSEPAGTRSQRPKPPPPDPTTPLAPSPVASQEPPRFSAAERPAPADRPAPERASKPASDSPLASSLRTDAARLHRDAQRLHRDAEQLGDIGGPPRAPAPSGGVSKPRRPGHRSETP
ncbi:type IV secretion system protein [Conexibacter sp. CPCC 206217]|uniref:type IV secretion system protein n=1 Tax=Conexibacter sp. CPCC 206217 TaxID=3064574 RepID=UPI0027221BA0|nr:type IV secretion system protein [Conexibacter sp. CPCC 206217]MDO8213909.1 type IV secretion system protein [Conexibacter sp. CPCC 206217]